MKTSGFTNELKMEVVVGAFMVMIFLGLGYFTIILSRERWFGPKYTIEVVFQHIMGLRDGDNVVVRGMPVGKVTELILKKDGVHVMANLEEKLTIREKYRVTIVSTSVLGGRYMQVDEGPKDGAEIPPGTVLDGEQPYDLMAEAAEIVHELKVGLVGGGAISNFQNIAEQLSDVSTRLNAGEGSLGKFMKDDQLYEEVRKAVSEIRGTIDDYRETAPVVTFTSVFFGAF